MTLHELSQAIRGRLIVSCQAGEGDAFRDSGLIARFAIAAVAGGAAAIRANGPADVGAIRAVTKVPLIGIEKVMQEDGARLITPSFESAKALVEAGADMVALDCTLRGQRSGALKRIPEIRRKLHVPVLADVADVDQAVAAAGAGADFVLSTLRGYTEETNHAQDFDPEFIVELSRGVNVPVIAEGRIFSPEQARSAIASGAFAVVVGSAITRPTEITRRFVGAIQNAWSRHNAMSTAIGIDMGGTQTKWGLVSSDGGLLSKNTTPTPANAGGRALLKHLKSVAQGAISQAAEIGREPSAIGVATAGWVEAPTGRVAYATDNLPGWTGARLAEEIADATGLPVAAENDANALAIAEKHFGTAKSLHDFVCLTLGTGLGGGCYIGGNLNRGAHYFANAIGHIPLVPGGLPCSCGLHGCLEVYVNSAALVRYAEDSAASAADVIAAANAGEQKATNAIRILASYLARGLAFVVALLDPEALILGGGLVENNEALVTALRGELAELVSPWEERGLRVMASKLGYYGGVLGAAALAFERETNSEPSNRTLGPAFTNAE